MKCLCCSSENVKARVTLEYDVPMAARNGAIKIGGIKVTQMDLRDKWETLAARPVYCHDCGQLHYWMPDGDPKFVKAEDTETT